MLKLGDRKSFGEQVRPLTGGAYVFGYNALGLSNVGSEEVVLECEVFVAGGNLGDIDQA